MDGGQQNWPTSYRGLILSNDLSFAYFGISTANIDIDLADQLSFSTSTIHGFGNVLQSPPKKDRPQQPPTPECRP